MIYEALLRLLGSIAVIYDQIKWRNDSTFFDFLPIGCKSM